MIHGLNPLKAGLFRQGENAADSGAKSREWAETYPKDFRNQGLNWGVLVRQFEAELRISGSPGARAGAFTSAGSACVVIDAKPPPTLRLDRRAPPFLT